MIDPVTAIGVLKLATWGLRAVNEVVKLNNLNQKKTSGNKSSSGAISKLDRELKAAELKYYQGKTKRDRDSLAIEKQKLTNDNIRIEIEEARLGIDVDRLKLSKQERQDRLEISRLNRELLKEIQIEVSKVKLQGKQIDWDNTRDNWVSKISREETQFILTKYNHRLLILTSPPEVDPYFDNAQNFQQWSFKLEMRKVDKFLSQYYSSQSAECPVQFYCDYFRETISKIDVNRLHDLLSSVATYVLYSDISDDTVTFWVAHWQTEQSEATHFQPFEWNWRETKDKLVAQGETEAAAILVVKQTIIEIHRLLTAYLADSYYLTIDPFYEPQLFEIFKQEEQPALQPFVESLREFQVEQRTAYEQELAQREEEHSRQESARQQELARQQLKVEEAERIRQQQLRVEEAERIRQQQLKVEEAERIRQQQLKVEEAERVRQRQLITSKADFRELDQFLSQGKWSEADWETTELILKCANRENERWLDIHSCRNFPQEELRIIDQLWLKYSQNKFGFSVQKKIWADNGGKPGSYDYTTLVKLADKIGWRKGGLWLDYGELPDKPYRVVHNDIVQIIDNLPAGHLPAHVTFLLRSWVGTSEEERLVAKLLFSPL
jgi:GUN4-like